MQTWFFRGTLLLAAGIASMCVLGFYRTTAAAPPSARQPFANSVTQREQMIHELREIKALLKEQNALMRAQENQQSDPTNDR